MSWSSFPFLMIPTHLLIFCYGIKKICRDVEKNILPTDITCIIFPKLQQHWMKGGHPVNQCVASNRKYYESCMSWMKIFFPTATKIFFISEKFFPRAAWREFFWRGTSLVMSLGHTRDDHFDVLVSLHAVATPSPGTQSSTLGSRWRSPKVATQLLVPCPIPRPSGFQIPDSGIRDPDPDLGFRIPESGIRTGTPQNPNLTIR
jgi:hypothetical protein